MAILVNKDLRCSVEDKASSGALNSGNEFRLDSATGTFNSLAANAHSVGTMVSELKRVRSTKKTNPADGQARPRTYDTGVDDIENRTVTGYYKDDSADTNPATFFRKMVANGHVLDLKEWPASGGTARFILSSYRVVGYRTYREDNQQMYEATLEFEGGTLTDSR